MLPVLRIAKSYLVVTFVLTCAVHAQHRKPKTFHRSDEPVCHHSISPKNKSNKIEVPRNGNSITSFHAKSSCQWEEVDFQTLSEMSPESLVIEMQGLTNDCSPRWLFDFQDTYSPVIFSNENLNAVMQSVIEQAEHYDGTYSSGMFGLLYYLHAALYHESWGDLNVSLEQFSKLDDPLEVLSNNSNLYELTEPALLTLYEIMQVADTRTLRHTSGSISITKDMMKNVAVTENWRSITDELIEYYYGLAHNQIHFLIFRGTALQDAQFINTLSQDAEFFNLLGNLGLMKELRESENIIYVIENVPGSIGYTAEIGSLRDLAIPEAEKIYKANVYERLEVGWIELVEIILEYGDCSNVDICDESIQSIMEELRGRLFPNTFSFDDGKLVVKTPLSIEKVQTLYYAAKQVESNFYRLLGSDSPLPDDPNDVLNMVVYGSLQDYEDYQFFLNGLSTNNGGIYIESDATFYTYDRTPQESIYTLEELFRHEYVHYLQARFIINGFYGETEFYQNNRLTWLNEGMAEFLAGSTRSDGIKIRRAILDQIRNDESDRMLVNEVVGASYDGGFKFYRYGGVLWSYWYEKEREFYNEILDLVINDDLTGYVQLLESLKNDEHLQQSYTEYLDEMIETNSSWVVETPWLDDSSLLVESIEDLIMQSTSSTSIDTVYQGTTAINKRFVLEGKIDLVTNEDNPVEISDFENALNELLIANTSDDVSNNMMDAVGYFKNIDITSETADFVITGPLRAGELAPPTSDFVSLDQVIELNSPVQFVNTSIGATTEYLWEFNGGNPSTSNGRNPIVTYSEPGFYTVKLTASNVSGSSEVEKEEFILAVKNIPTGHCSTNNTASDNFINYVEFGDIRSESNWENYTFSKQFTILTPGDNETLKISTDWLDQGVEHTLGVWIDWNQDYSFDDSGETIINVNHQGTPLDKSITVPISAKSGLTKMRVRINNWSEPSDPCGDDTIGEVEDYLIWVEERADDGQVITSVIEEEPINLFPNPSTGKITLVRGGLEEDFIVYLYNSTGKLLDQRIYSNSEDSYHIDYSHLRTGLYNINIIGQNTVFKKKLIISR